jgi:hypothetical protein
METATNARIDEKPLGIVASRDATLITGLWAYLPAQPDGDHG